MTGLECLREEMRKRGLNQAQCESKVAAVVLDILTESGNKFTAEWQTERSYEDKERAIERLRRSAERERESAERQERTLSERFKQLNKKADEIHEYIERFYSALENCETPEAKDAIKRAQIFVNSVNVETKYDNTAFIIGLSAILSCGKTAQIDELRKINKKIPGYSKEDLIWIPTDLI